MDSFDDDPVSVGGTERENSVVGGDRSNDEALEFTPSKQSLKYSLFECKICGSIVLGIEKEPHELSCHDQPMQPVDDPGIDHSDPELDDLIGDVFDLSRMTLDMCHFVFEQGMASASETAERFDYDRSTVSRYLRDLSEIGFLERHTLNREGGGIVHVYRAKPIDDTRRAELVSLLHWTGKAAQVLDEANEIKAECVESDSDLEEIFWEVYQEKRTR